jgi:Protein of unknown function (DUF2950)/Protein of unknown function (DUF2934)
MKSQNLKTNGHDVPTGILQLDFAEEEGKNGPTRAEIRQRAFEIHIERGGIHGCDLDDYLQADPLHGYYFLRVSDDADITAGAVLFVAYPVNYRFSGVMTFVITSDDLVFQKDLGPNTPRLARARGKDTPDLSWQVAE